MKKIFLLICLLITTISVKAATITNSEYDNGQITLSGTGTEQVQIVLFDKENEPVYMGTDDVVNGEFSFTLPQIANLSDGKYIIKVADYDGQNSDSKEITIENSAVKNPKTSDNIMVYIVSAILCLIGIIGILCFIFIKKKHENKN